MSLWTRKTRRKRAAEPETTIRSRLAIFGGTFDPIHNAHLTVAREAVLQYGLSTVLFVVACNPPHKTGSTLASYEQRYRMVELACQRSPEFTPSRIEEDEAISYSIHTIERVKAVAGPEALVYFLIGADAFSEIGTWHRCSDVVRQVAFIVVTRPGHHYRTPPGATVHRLNTLAMPVSSSDIRASLAAGKVSRELPPAVMDYIQENGLYGYRPR
jgi:nicotinate-nucleotide adenylyltransferase